MDEPIRSTTHNDSYLVLLSRTYTKHRSWDDSAITDNIAQVSY